MRSSRPARTSTTRCSIGSPHGSPTSAATSTARSCIRRWRGRSATGTTQCSTSRSRRRCSPPWSTASPRRTWCRTDSGSSSRSRSGTTSQSARAARSRPAPLSRRVPDLPDRPLPREDGARGDPVPAVREHDARAGVEPQLPRMRADHDGRELRGGGSRALLRSGRRAARRRRQPPVAAACHRGDGAARRAAIRTRSRTPSGPCSGRCRTPTHRTTCAASTTATATPTASRRTRPPRRTPRSASRSTTGGGPACRSSCAPASTWRSGRPSCGCCSSIPRACTSSPPSTAGPQPNQIVFKIDPSTGIRLILDAQRADKPGANEIEFDVEFSQEGGEGADALRGAAARRAVRRRHRTSPARTTSRRRGGSSSRCSIRRRPFTRTPQGSWGPEEADDAGRPLRRLARALGAARGLESARGVSEKQVDRLLEQLAYAGEELRRGSAVQDPVVARERRGSSASRGPPARRGRPAPRAAPRPRGSPPGAG